MTTSLVLSLESSAAFMTVQSKSPYTLAPMILLMNGSLFRASANVTLAAATAASSSMSADDFAAELAD